MVPICIHSRSTSYCIKMVPAKPAFLPVISMVFYLLSMILTPNVLANAPHFETVKQWSRNIKEELIEDIGDQQLFGMLKTGFSDENNYQNVNGSEIVKEMAKNLAYIFVKKVEALQKLKNKAEAAILSYENVAMTKQPNIVQYYNMKNTVQNEPIQLKYHSRFKQEVSFNQSGVYVPFGTDERSPTFMQKLKWSETLDPVFRENWEENTEFAWQFLATKEFMRIYPASRWKDLPENTGFYDIQERPWHMQGMAAPKDMIILMDVSGSVHGQTLEIMKASVKAMLDTLGGNDYVNVLRFNNQVGFTSCFTDFVQANSRNKRVLADSIDYLEAANTSNYGQAFKFAFEQFRNFNESKKDYKGAECHNVIALFTDGGTERPDEVFKKYNKDKQFRIFTYAVGPHLIPIHTLKAIACENRGYFYTITSMDEISSTVRHYLNVLARPKALADDGVETYSSAYTDAGGLGTVITITLPVYNRSEGNQTVAGIVGIDVPMEDIAKALPKDKTGPNSYVFAINQNGFAILHPKMSTQKNYLEDVPSIDLLDLENNDPSQEPYIEMLRVDMINEKTNSRQYRTYVNTGDQYHIVEKNMTYYFTPIDGTSISLGIAIPEDRKAFINVKGYEYEVVDKLDVNSTAEGVIIAPWKFCPEIKENGDKTNDIDHLVAQLQENHFSICNRELIRRLAFDIRQTKNIHVFIAKKKSESLVLGKYKSAIFMGTDGGLMRIFPRSKAGSFARVKDPYTATYFKKALRYAPRWAFFVSDQIIYGMLFKEPAFHDMLKTKIDNDGVGCDKNEKTACYLLDDGGYIIASNQDDHSKQTGQFLGDTDSVLMWHLNMRNDSIYKRRMEYDYNAICKNTDRRISAASRNQYIPALSTFFQSVLHLLMDAVVWLAISGSSVQTSTAAKVVGLPADYSCTKVRTLYYPHQMHQEGKIDNCNINNNCTREFSAVQIQDSNLFLVVATAQAACPVVACENVRMQHRPAETGENDTCAMESRYRKRPSGNQQSCLTNNPQEDTSICTDGTDVIRASSTFSAVAISVTVLLWKCHSNW